jgi:importin-9
MCSFCQGGDEAVLLPFVPQIARILGPFLLSTTEDTLSLVVEALSVVVEVNDSKWMSPELAGSLTGAILEVWKQNNKGRQRIHGRRFTTFMSLSIDPIILSVLSDILQTLASSEASGVYTVVVQSALPSLTHAIGAAKTEESWIVSAAIELVSSLASGAKEGALGDGFFAMLAPNLFTCLQVAEDRDVLQVKAFNLVLLCNFF